MAAKVVGSVCHLLSWSLLAGLLETICFSEMLVDYQRTTRCYIPKDSTLDVILSAEMIRKETQNVKDMQRYCHEVFWAHFSHMPRNTAEKYKPRKLSSKTGSAD
jgi:hypothetical protein